MLSNDQLFMLVAVVAWLVWFNSAANSAWIAIPAIKRQKFPNHPTRGAYKSKKISERIYIIAGGSGFVGSWICRYLLARGETHIFVLDRNRPPIDIMKPELTYIEMDLTSGSSVERELTRIRSMVLDTSQIIVYNCSLVRRYSLQNFRADLGVAAAEFLYVGLRIFENQQVIVIHVGDSMAHRLPVRNWDRVWPSRSIWCQVADGDTESSPDVLPLPSQHEAEEDARDRSFSSYSWHQKQVEEMTLKLTNYHPAVAASAVLRIEGLCSGHLGDGLLSPITQCGYMIVHSPNVPITIVHVEDVVRGCLSLEHMLADPSTREEYSGCKFTVGSSEVTSLRRVAEYIKSRRPHFHVWYIPSALVYLATWLMGCVYLGKPVAMKGPRDTLLKISPKALTFARFYTLQTGQIPNAINEQRQHQLLHLENNFSLSQTIDGVLNEVGYVETHFPVVNKNA